MPKFRFVVCLAALLAGAALLSAALPAPAAPLPPQMRGFQAVGPRAGWVLLDQRLYWTDDAGAQWTERTPAAAPGALLAGFFLDEQTGWLLAASGADPHYDLLTTTDGGATWQTAALSLFAPDDVAALPAQAWLSFSDAQRGWLVIKQASGSAFDRRTAFQTSDGGRTWQRQPAGALPASAVLDADRSMLDADTGWALTRTGACEATGCALTTQLQATTDGGATWQPLTLPGGAAALVQAVPAAELAQTTAGGYSLTYNGAAFDGCFVDRDATPSAPAGMQNWLSNSPYRARNLYIGGSGGAPCTPLTKSYVQQLAQQGWLFIPTWVGPQSPCYVGAKTKMSGDLTLAFQQGRTEAHLALDRAVALGLARPDGSGTVLFYDVEIYPNNSGCREAVKAFISGWTAVVRAAGSLSGVYGSPCTSYLPDLAGISNVPDAVWLAYWQMGGYDPAASVFGIPCISDTLWSQSQRLRQYTGGHNETWGGLTLNIDSNVLAGPVVTAATACQPDAHQIAVFTYPDYSGPCALRSSGIYTTVESLGLPNDTISSIRIGYGARVKVCENVDLGGTCTDLVANAPALGVLPIGDNNVSSFVIDSAPLTLTRRVFFPLSLPRAPVVSLLPNGSFEAGSDGWGLSSTNGRALIVTRDVLSATGQTVPDGQRAVWLGGVVSETAALAQTIPVPADAPYLAYWQWIESDEAACHYDVVSIWVNETVVEAYGLCASTASDHWTRRSVNLSAYAGQSIALRIQFAGDASDVSSLFLDEVAFEASP